MIHFFWSHSIQITFPIHGLEVSIHQVRSLDHLGVKENLEVEESWKFSNSLVGNENWL